MDCDRQQQQSDDVEAEAGAQGARRTEPLDDGLHERGLDEHEEEADAGEDEPDRAQREIESVLAEQGERGLEAGERRCRRERADRESPQIGPHIGSELRYRLSMIRRRIDARRRSLGETANCDDPVHEREASGEIEGHVWPAERGERADGRSGDEADAERGGQQAEESWAVGRFGDIGDRRLARPRRSPPTHHRRGARGRATAASRRRQ